MAETDAKTHDRDEQSSGSEEQSPKKLRCARCNPKSMTSYGVTKKELRFLRQKHKHVELGTGSVMSLLLFQTIPAFISFLSISLYSVVDSIYVGHGIGEIGLAGMGVYGPIDQGLVFNICMFSAFGASSLATQALGQKNIALAESYLMYYVLTALVTCCIIIIVLVPLMNPMLEGLGATDEVREMTYPYGVTLAVNSLAFTMNNGLGPFMRLENKPIDSMVRLIVFAMLNIIIDPIFIFVAHLNLFGASLSTLISGVIVATYFVVWYSRPNSTATMHIKLKYISPKRINCKNIGKMLILSIGPTLQNCFVSIVTIFVNMQITKFSGDDEHYRNVAISAYGVCNRVFNLVTTCVFGIIQAVMPIFGYNRGAKNWVRAYNSIIGALFWIILITLILEIIIIGLADYVVLAFGSGEEFKKLAPLILRIIMSTIFSATINCMISNYFVIIQKKILALVAGLSRGVLFIVLIYVLPFGFSDKFLAIWLSVPISDIASLLITLGVFIPNLKALKKLADNNKKENGGKIYNFKTLITCYECKRTKDEKSRIIKLIFEEEERIKSMDDAQKVKEIDGVIIDNEDKEGSISIKASCSIDVVENDPESSRTSDEHKGKSSSETSNSSSSSSTSSSSGNPTSSTS